MVLFVFKIIMKVIEIIRWGGKVMKFSEKVKVVKEKVGDNILFVENGNFYIAIGKDACFLNKLFKLKCTCFVKYICKVGVPVKSIEKYLKALREREYSYIVCRFTSDGIKVLYRNEDENKNDEKLENLGCINCQNAIYGYSK